MDDREQRGLAIAALFRIDRDGDKYLVPSQKGNGTRYVVDPNPEKPSCTCQDHQDRGIKCKHLYAVEFAQTREQDPDGTVRVERTIKLTEKVTYKQNWPAYNAAQTNEKRLFLALLADLCKGVQQPPRNPKGGRQPFLWSDMIFTLVFKVYSTVSARRFKCDLDDAVEKGHIKKSFCFNQIFKVMHFPETTAILKRLIIESSKPLAAVETCFASDSTGFSTCRFVRWFDIKYGKTMEEREWVKVHCACGVNTNVITAVEIYEKNAADAPQLPALVRQTAENFTVKEWSGDSAYASQENFGVLDEVKATPYLAFKETHTGQVGGLFQKAYHYYSTYQEEFFKHYHKRSNAESTFSMVKAKFGDALRSKTDTAMINEVLCKILCHNICVLIQSFFELGIDPEFWGRKAPMETSKLPVPGAGTVDESVEMWAWV